MDQVDEDGIPVHGWTRFGDQEYPEVRDQKLRPSFNQIRHLIPLSIRYAFHFIWHVLWRRKPPIDQVRMENGKCIYGVPCGGIGSGSIGRGFRGEFCRFQMVPGMYSYDIIWSDAFHLIVKNADGSDIVLHSVLGSKKNMPSSFKHLNRWEYNFKDENIKYHGLYPQSWTVFRIPELKLRLVCHQVSPILPHNYKDSSFPVTMFNWSVINDGNVDYMVEIAFTFKNGWNNIRQNDLAPQTRSVNAEDMCIKHIDHQFREGRLSYAIASLKSDSVDVDELEDFDADSNGLNFIKNFRGEYFERSRIKNVCVALKSSVMSKSGPSREAKMKFGLCWDMPVIKFRQGSKAYRRKYLQFFPNVEDVATEILRYGFENCEKWVKSIEDWQNPILTDPDLPNWFKSAVFNELYYLSDGGSQWLQFEDDEHEADPRKIFGRFAYLESHEYRLFNTYDVHFYASSALIGLFPGLQLSLQIDMCEATTAKDDTRVTELYHGKRVALNPENSVPHDLGDPEAEPFVRVNAYRIHDVSEWKDLNLKFVISTWRDYVWTCRNPNLEISARFVLQKCWPVCIELIDRVRAWDKDLDGLIENAGVPDQTYDSWVMTGPSSYCNSLWIAALACMESMAKHIGEGSDFYEQLLERATSSFHQKLWADEGDFFKFDSSEKGSNVIMSDQLCGLWYLNFCQIRRDIFDKEKVDKALETIFKYNVKMVKNGTTGAVNGMLYREAKVDKSTVQSEEIWTGVTYALASLMISQKHIEMGFATAEGIYNTVYEKIGMGFETPEALYENDHYRAIGYMRPLSIWSMYEAWKLLKE